MEQILIFRCPCGAVIMKGEFPIDADNVEWNKEIIDCLASGYIPSVEENNDTNKFSPHKDDCINKPPLSGNE